VSNSQPTHPAHSNSRKPRRRPTGVSRSQRRKTLGFETLEDRRVMSASSPFGPQQLNFAESLQQNTVSFSSASPQGQAYILQQELTQYLSQSANHVDASPLAIPNDPYLDLQWSYINTGQQVGNPDFQVIFGVPGEDINVLPVWQQDIFGNGVVVQINDSGTEITHPDLIGNIDPSLQFDALTGDADANPELPGFNPVNAHGTSVAGIVGASANDIGGVGVAPGVQLVPVRLIDMGQTEQAFIDAFRFRTDVVDVTTNSWGPGIVRGLAGPTPNQLLALRDSIFGPLAGRDGLGTIHVFAAGNSGEELDTASYNGWVNSRYTIGVTGVDHDGQYNNIDGTVTGYPETSASTLVAAPTGSVALLVGDDSGVGSGIFAPDTTGDTGFNTNPEPNGEQTDLTRDFFADEAYTTRFNGTSAAAPHVSGVVALMLEANPNLSWRDVQEIMVRSARQNSEFDTLANGTDKAVGIEYQSTWIVNQVPLFHDPDVWDPLINNGLQIMTPTLNPLLTTLGSGSHYAPTPQVLTNAAGYTVSQGRGTNQDQIGFAHGTVDAELAVQLAQQWHSKGQQLPDELTFTTTIDVPFADNLPRAVVINPGGLDLIVPGGLGGGDAFGAYWNEYFEDEPDFSQAFDSRGVPLELTVPDTNEMVVESLDINLTISGGTAEALDHVRIILVSPNGTHSELNHYFVDPSFAVTPDVHQAFNPALQPNGLNAVSAPADFLDPGSVDNGGDLVFTFSTNRVRGERSDDALIFDPTTNEPFATPPGAGGKLYNLVDATNGDFLESGWQLYFENYGTTTLEVDTISTTWHGSPINPATQRLQGLIGVDSNRDDLFNFSRVEQFVVDNDGDPTTLRLGEVQNIIDPTHESMGSNVTVLAYRDANGNGVIDATDQLVDQFLTGADGNYYFDLLPDNYIITLDSDSLGGFTALDDSLSPSGFLPDYQAQWTISSDYFQVWDYDASLEVPLDPATGAPIPLLDGSNTPVEYHVNHINFLLDPGAPAAPEVVFNGTVIADVNGDGSFNGVDTVAAGILVYGDTNLNNQFDSGEVFTTTDANGLYSLTVPSATTQVIQVGVQAPPDWVATAPTSGIRSYFTQQGDVIDNVDFALRPPVAGPGVNGTQPGTIIGFVFDDDNRDGIKQTSEGGLGGVTVYIDNNLSGSQDAGDTVTVTNGNGAYIFNDVPVGTHQLRVSLASGSTLDQTFPIFGLANVVTLAGAQTVSGVRFGLDNAATLDFGDLPARYGVTTLPNAARHPKGPFFLGEAVDAELDGQPSETAEGDFVGVNDDDGVVVDPLVAGGVGQLVAEASLPGGFLQGWIDFNGDNDFDDVIGGVSERILINENLNQGFNTINFQIPDVIDATTVFARFRYGNFNLGLTGLAFSGEVEDYVLQKAATPLNVVHGPDFDEDGDVDGGDFLAWQRGFGIQNYALAGNGDANSDGAVDAIDLGMVLQDFGQTGGLIAGLQAPPPPMDQPYFEETLDTSLPQALVVSGMQQLPPQQQPAVATRLDSGSDAWRFDSSSSSAAESAAHFRDLAFGNQQHEREELAAVQTGGSDAEEALAVALGEVADWRTL